jgi:hypothetical protein
MSLISTLVSTLAAQSTTTTTSSSAAASTSPCVNNTVFTDSYNFQYTIYCGNDSSASWTYADTFNSGDWRQCCPYCDTNAGCSTWTWIPQASGGRCYIKPAGGKLGIAANSTYISGWFYNATDGTNGIEAANCTSSSPPTTVTYTTVSYATLTTTSRVTQNVTTTAVVSQWSGEQLGRFLRHHLTRSCRLGRQRQPAWLLVRRRKRKRLRVFTRQPQYPPYRAARCLRILMTRCIDSWTFDYWAMKTKQREI